MSKETVIQQESILQPNELSYVQNRLKIDPLSTLPIMAEGFQSRKEFQEKFPLRYQYATDIRTINEVELQKRRTILTVLKNLATFMESPKALQLYGAQMDVIRSISSYFEQGYLNGYVNLPTGFGKGVILSLLTEAFGVECNIVTSRVKLVEDLSKVFKRFTQQEPGIVHANTNETEKDITIGTYNAYRDNKLPKTHLLVFDEAHNVLGDKTAIQIKEDPAVIKLGLTASDEYSENRSVSNVLPTLMHDVHIEEAVKMGLCSPFSVTIAETGINLTNLPKDRQRWGREVNSEAILRTIVEIHNKFHKGRKAMVCCNYVNQTEQMTQLFKEAGISATFVHNKQNRKEQNEAVKTHEEGKTEVLSGIKIPGEGHDDPKVEVIYFAGGVSSSVKVIQFAGRALRVDSDNRRKKANIIHVVNPGNIGVTYPEAVGTTGVLSSLPGESIIVPNSKYGASIIVKPTDIYSILNEDLIKHGLPEILTDEGVWLTEKQIKANLGISYPEKFNYYLNSILESLTERELHLVRQVKKSPNHMWYPHYHPWLVDKLREQFDALKKWPEGYKDIYYFAPQLNRSTQQLESEIKKRMSKNKIPSFEVKIGERQHGHRTRLYPEWILDFLQDYKKLPVVPEDQDWYSFDQLRKQGINRRKILDQFIEVNNLREEHPDWFGRFSNPNGMNTDFYSQAFLDFWNDTLKNNIRPELPAESNWYSENRIRKEFNIGYGAGRPLKRFINTFNLRQYCPDWFESFSINNVNYEFYSEEFVSALAGLQMPDGFKTRNAFILELEQRGIKKAKINNIINSAVEIYPELQTEYLLNDRNYLAESLSPQLMEIVLDQVGISP